jgi:hypothetical protein
VRTWIRCRVKFTTCGSCTADIPQGTPLLQVGESKLERCPACAKRLFSEEPPTEFPEDDAAVPQPPVLRQPDFVTPRNWAKQQQDEVDPKWRQIPESQR